MVPSPKIGRSVELWRWGHILLFTVLSSRKQSSQLSQGLDEKNCEEDERL